MFPKPAKNLTAIAGLCLLVAFAGCRNGRLCGVNPCNPCFDGFGASTAVPAPATYSTRIPSAGQNQPYYNGGTATAQNLLQPGGAAPTPAGGTSPNLAPQNGWRAAGSNDSSQYVPASNNQARSVLASSSGNRQFPSTSDPNSRITGSSLASNGGLSFRDNNNYRSTAVDERLDQTRLTATDATNVRAPVRFQQPATMSQAGQFPVAPSNYGNVVTAPQNPALYSNQRLAQNQPLIHPANPSFAPRAAYGTGSSNVAANVIQGRVEYYGQPTFASPVNQTYPGLATSAPTVLAQSTVYSDPRGTQNYQNGWRDRDLNSINR